MNSGQSAILSRRAPNAHLDPTLAQHAPLVRRLAHQLARLASSTEIDDLIEIGMIGLAEATSHFDAAPDEQFENFATTHICDTMLDALILADQSDRFYRGLRSHQVVLSLQGLAQLHALQEPGSLREMRGSPAPQATVERNVIATLRVA